MNIGGNPYVEGEEQEYTPGRMVEMLVHGDEVYIVSNTTYPTPHPIRRFEIMCLFFAD